MKNKRHVNGNYESPACMEFYAEDDLCSQSTMVETEQFQEGENFVW